MLAASIHTGWMCRLMVLPAPHSVETFQSFSSSVCRGGFLNAGSTHGPTSSEGTASTMNLCCQSLTCLLVGHERLLPASKLEEELTMGKS